MWFFEVTIIQPASGAAGDAALRDFMGL